MDIDNLSVLCNWNIEEAKDLRKTITFCSKEEILRNDIDSIKLENCLCLIQNPKLPSKMKLDLQVKGKVISHIDIISEAQVIETFGNSGEYLSTFHGEFIVECGGIAAFHTKIQMPSVHKCSLQFTRINDESRLWIYDIKIVTNDMTESTQSLNFNFDNVNKLIEKSSHGLSKKAEKFKTFLQLYSSGQGSDFLDQKSTVPPQMMFKILEGEYFSHLKDYKKSMSDCINSISGFNLSHETSSTTGFSNPDKADTDVHNKSSTPVQKSMSLDECCDVLKIYIDTKFKEIQEEIFLQIENQFKNLQNEQNEKLDKIISLLQDKSNTATISNTSLASNFQV